jgi:hypothetical protein
MRHKFHEVQHLNLNSLLPALTCHYPSLDACSLFTGGVLYISAIEIPAGLKYSYAAFNDYFSDMYPR